MTTRRKSSVKRAELEELLKNDSNILKILMKESLHEVLDAQMTEALSAAGSERVDGRLGYRVGRYGRSLVTRIEKLERRMPRDRAGHISTESLERYQVIAEHAGFRFRNLELGSCPPLLRDVTRFVEPRRAVDCAQSRVDRDPRQRQQDQGGEHARHFQAVARFQDAPGLPPLFVRQLQHEVTTEDP